MRPSEPFLLVVPATCPIVRARWALWTALACRIVDALSAALGAAGGPEPGFKVAGAVALVPSIAAIIMLIRFSRRRTFGAASAA
jgi:hypothetical protein